jgi:hypothetical protein
MQTAFLLMAHYGGRAVIPIEDVARDYFGHLTPDKLARKLAAGDIPLPVIRIENSQKAAKGVHLIDLADYIDRQRAAAVKEFQQLHGSR